jgi:hypothetical protein
MPAMQNKREVSCNLEGSEGIYQLRNEQQVQVHVHVQLRVKVRVMFNRRLWPSTTYKRERGSQGVGNEQKFVRIGR